MITQIRPRVMMAELAFEIRVVWLVFLEDRTLLKERLLSYLEGFVLLPRGVVVFCIVRVCILSLSRVLSSRGSQLSSNRLGTR